MNKGFTIIELAVTIAIIAILSSIILFSVTQYINTGKDTNVEGNLVALIPAGEAYYNGESAAGDGYNGFCSSGPVKNAILQLSFPANASDCSTQDGNAHPGFCCNINTVDNNYDSWAACAQLFTNPKLAYCVDSVGVKEEICNSDCSETNLVQCKDYSSNPEYLSTCQ